MRLNPKKCVLGITSGKFLGHLVSSQGIEENPDKITSLVNIRSPKCIKEVDN